MPGLLWTSVCMSTSGQSGCCSLKQEFETLLDKKVQCKKGTIASDKLQSTHLGNMVFKVDAAVAILRFVSSVLCLLLQMYDEGRHPNICLVL